MSHDNFGFTGSTNVITVKKQPNGLPDPKFVNTKDNLKNGFHSIEAQDKAKKAKELEGELYDPYKNREVEHPTTYCETLFHLLKGSLGTGILAMPHAFSYSGYIVGIIGTIVIGFITTYCIRCLILSCYELCKRRRTPSMTYPATMQTALEEGPKFLRPLAPYCPHICNTFLLVYQLGTCCVYTVFIAENLQEALHSYVGGDGSSQMTLRLYMLCLVIPLILINWVKNLKVMAPLSTLATFITFVSFGILLYLLFDTPEQKITIADKIAVGDVTKFPLFLGTVLFALEAIGVIMPLENEMKKPRSFIKPSGVLNVGMIFNILLYIGLGLFGYLKYGADVNGTVTKSLLAGPLAQTVQLLLAIAIFITHSLQCYVAIDISWNEYLQPKFSHYSEAAQFRIEYAVRTFLVIFTCLLAMIYPKLDLFIALFGALCLAALGITFPALITICSFWKTKTTVGRTFLVLKNGALMIFGIFACCIGTYTSLLQIVETFGADNSSINATEIIANTTENIIDTLVTKMT